MFPGRRRKILAGDEKAGTFARELECPINRSRGLFEEIFREVGGLSLSRARDDLVLSTLRRDVLDDGIREAETRISVGVYIVVGVC